MPDDDLLRRIDAYLDAAPRTGAQAETVGPFTLFLNEGHGWRYYARPSPGEASIDVETVRAVRRRQRALAQPEALEWIDELTPDVSSAASDDGMRVIRHPLMALSAGAFMPAAPPAGASVRIVDADDDLAGLGAVAEVGFASRGTAVGREGAAEATQAAARANRDTIEFQRGRMLAGLTIAAAADVSGVMAAVGAHQPLEATSEIVGVATLPSYRRRGLGAAVTTALVADALERGVTTVFLSADDDDVARVYERIGFRRIGTAGAASIPSGE
ncbi:MAG TPA: GNAT family N-acetyltransferase [Actinomycetota bacterium]|nr:GNAT family N-acetyltransferase [Actinomycetota bacterium]